MRTRSGNCYLEAFKEQKCVYEEPAEAVTNIFANIEIKTIKNAIEILFLVKIFVLSIIYNAF